MFTVYILYSEKINQFYTGYTNNLTRRISEHNRRKGKFTDRGIPWIVVHTENFSNKKDAENRKTQIKNKKSRSYIENIIRSSDDRAFRL
ncbi:MAG: GIY-YIG nuclease family protein [Bacteroidales bacterium]